MRYYETIIVGAGPAGSSCAYELRKEGLDVLILDKEEFPRAKLCAGWITPKVKDILELKDYPHKIMFFQKLHVNIFGRKKEVDVSQYSIRRIEFDDYLLKRSKTRVEKHTVKEIKKDGDIYIIDNKYKCRNLVGAGGTFCPVYMTFFKEINPRVKTLQVTALEEEFKYDYKDKDCHLWFFHNSLPGYSWYVPKENGYINVGIGGQFEKIKDKNNNINSQWKYFTSQLKEHGLITNHEFKPTGYVYYMRQNVERCHLENAYIIGDSAGLSTLDLGEGIGPAIESGIICAKAIVNCEKMSFKDINKNSLNNKATYLFFKAIKKFYTKNFFH